jgi:hypothetical protein
MKKAYQKAKELMIKLEDEKAELNDKCEVLIEEYDKLVRIQQNLNSDAVLP